ncbi:MAG TPA: guanylate kinase [Prevotellaceae bacterium]|nr:guanylate kinase [Prevotellaceae bacterium]
MEGKLIVFSAPSGSGKSTIINCLMQNDFNLHFSVSATSRAPRGQEQNGKEYFFLTPEQFKEKIKENAFLEYEEVYHDKYYGTLKSEVEKQLKNGENVVLDIDVKGALNVKRIYGNQALLVFIQPPSVETLRQRLQKRGTDSPEVIEDRVKKAEYELSFAKDFDVVIINDQLEIAVRQATETVVNFLHYNHVK